MELELIGATRQVTGSMHLLTLDSGYRILIDCGLDYEVPGNEVLNTYFPFEPESIDVLVVTHAHIDHSGNIPTLIRQGFNGNILCTEPTASLMGHLLRDSVSIQNKRRGRKKGIKLYGFEGVKKAMDQVVTLPFNETFSLTDEVNLTMVPAGHILGAASLKFTIKEQEREVKIGFTGDLGQSNNPLIGGWQSMGEVDYLVMESTYGNRRHTDKGSPEEVLFKHIEKTCHQQNGKLVIPAFSVGRTQSILFTLKNLSEQGQLHGVRVFADSPLARFSTMVHEDFLELLQPFRDGEVDDLFRFPELDLVEDEEDDEQMRRHLGPAIIISSAGMVEGGRIQRHIVANIENPFAKVLMAGFCAPGTVGAKLLSGNKRIHLMGRSRTVYADIDRTDVFSAHPDKDELVDYALKHGGNRLKTIFLVHGEESAIEELQEAIQERVGCRVEAPYSGDVFAL
jgi:metallo-beta-lactamase family protein